MWNSEKSNVKEEVSDKLVMKNSAWWEKLSRIFTDAVCDACGAEKYYKS